MNYVVHDEVQIAIQQCMKVAGFDYSPIPRPAPLISLNDLADRFSAAAREDPLTTEYRETYGFGVSTLWAYLVFIEPVTTDPNQARRGAMDADERRKYDIAYYGDDLVRAIEASSDGVIEMEPGGCLGGAKEGLTTEAPSFEGVEYVNEVEERLKGSPSYVLAEQEWARCVGELGYDVQRPSEVFDWLEAKLYEIGRDAIERDIIVADDPTSLTEQSPDALIMSDADAALLGARSPYSGEELAEVQAFEVQFALDIRECDVGFHAATREVREAIEAEFL